MYRGLGFLMSGVPNLSYMYVCSCACVCKHVCVRMYVHAAVHGGALARVCFRVFEVLYMVFIGVCCVGLLAGRDAGFNPKPVDPKP